MRFSKQRQLIYNFVQTNGGHLTADEVYTALKPENPALSLSTVYRNLNQLSEAGVLQKVMLVPGCSHFDKNAAPHCHLICSECGSVTDIDAPAAATVAAALGLEDQAVTSYALVLHGRCQSCAQK